MDCVCTRFVAWLAGFVDLVQVAPCILFSSLCASVFHHTDQITTWDFPFGEANQDFGTWIIGGGLGGIDSRRV